MASLTLARGENKVMNEAGNRFNEAVELEEKANQAGSEFMDSAFALDRELAEKGIQGKELTAAEKTFAKASATFMLFGMIYGMAGKKVGVKDA